MTQLKNSTPDPLMPNMMGGTPDAAMGMPTGDMGEDMGPTPDEIQNSEPESVPELPIESNSGGSKSDGLKRQLLQKMMENLLNKPGRSVNELVNGVKAVIGAYKNYAKEWDTLNGITEAPLPPAGSGDTSVGGGSAEIQAILDKIQAQKGAEGGVPPMGGSTAVPPSPPIGPMANGPSGLGGPGFNRPAPINRLGIWGY